MSIKSQAPEGEVKCIYLMTVFINSMWFNIIVHVIACNRDCVSKKTNSDHIIAATQQGP